MALARVAESERRFSCRRAKIDVVIIVVPTAANILLTCGDAAAAKIGPTDATRKRVLRPAH